MNGDPNVSIVFENMVAEWGGVSMAPLSVLLVHLRFLAFVHQTHHWVSKGDTFWGDHKLFEDLYNTTLEHIDSIAERAIGLGSNENVNITLQTKQLMRLVQGYGMTSTIPQPTEIAKRSLAAEINFLKTAEAAFDVMNEMGQTTPGLENLLGGIMDVHEAHVYKLKQRGCGQ